jgi:phospholipase C
VPLLVVSPWTRGGWVCSEVFDHTSILRFLERRFGVAEPNISPWRRAVCGDLTSMFDFANPDAGRPDGLFATSHRSYLERADVLCRNRKTASLPRAQSLPAPEGLASGTRPARPLPYRLAADGARDGDSFGISFANSGKAGAVFTVYSLRHNGGPWYFTLPAGDTFTETWTLRGFQDRQYDLRVHGPNGFVRVFRGTAGSHAEVAVQDGAARKELALRLTNRFERACTFRIRDAAYGAGELGMTVGAGETVALPWPVAASHGWYDLEISVDHDAAFFRRLCGHLEDGLPSRSDPSFGAARELFQPWPAS